MLRNDALDIILCPELLEALEVQDARQLQVVLLEYETKSTLGQHEGFLDRDAGEPASRVRMRLTGAEATLLLGMVENGSFPMSPAAVCVSDKVRRALALTGFDPDLDVQIDCTEDEAEFLARARVL